MPHDDPRVKELFSAAFDLSAAAEREAFLDRACADNPGLRRRVDALLRADANASAFAPDSPSPSVSPLTEQPGDSIGRYKLLQKIGEGGCGVVYLAQQHEPVRRKVALKVIKLGMDTREVIARFEAERQALALMDHPNIAKILDGGATGQSQISNLKSEIPAGRPYFVMELVRGIRITDFCDQNHLGLKERLELFMQVCQAVQHAHQKGIIHRDLKPSNILVTINDGVPVPKIIDFGIAKATQQELTEKTLFTAYGQFLGTPAYMSPEQTVLTSLDIDTRSDIYSLGVLLYELLTGKPPFDTQALLKVGLDELCRTLREVEPPRPSTRLSTLAGEALASIAKFRKTDAPRLVHHVRGDLDWIVMKCLEKDRARRYETASGVAADLQRHLGNEPVVARPPSSVYRLQKFVRRNKLAVIAAAAVLAALLAGLGISLWQYAEKSQALVRTVAAEREQSRLRQTAQTEATRSRQVSTLLQDMLNGVHPAQARGRDTTVLRGILQRTARRISSDLKEQPLVAAELRITLGRVYIALADFTNGVAMYREALSLRQNVYGTQHVEIVLASLELGHALAEHEQVEAEKTLRDALAMSTALLGREDAITARVLSSLAGALVWQQRYADAEPLAREAVASLQRHFGAGHAHVGVAQLSLGEALSRQRKNVEAEQVLREALAIVKRAHGDNDPKVGDLLSALGYALLEGGKPAAAEPIFREGLELERTLYGQEHPKVCSTLKYLARSLAELGRYPESESMFREVLAVERKMYGAEHSDIADTLNDLGLALAYQKKYAEAEQHSRDSLAMKEKLFGREDTRVAKSFSRLGSIFSVQGRHAEAKKSFQDALAILLKRLGHDHRDVSDCYHNLGLSLENQNQPVEAEAAFTESLAIRRKLPGYEHLHTAGALQHLALVRIRQGRDAEAEAPLREALALRRKLEGDGHLNTGKSFDLLLSCLERQRKFAEAIPLHRERLAWCEGRTNLSRGVLGDTQSRLGGAVLAATVIDATLEAELRPKRFAEAEQLLLSGQSLMQRSTAAVASLKRAGLERLVRLYTAWDELAPNTGHAAQAAEWKQKLADFDRTTAQAKPSGAEP